MFRFQHKHKNAFDEKVVAAFLEGRGLSLSSLMGIQYAIEGGELKPDDRQALEDLLRAEGWRLEWIDHQSFVISQ